MASKSKSTRRGNVLFVRGRNPGTDPEPMGHAEKFVGWAVGKALVWLGKRAAERGDWHELNHLIGALMTGNSTHTEENPCPLPEEMSHRPVSWSGYTAQRATGDQS